VPFDNFGNDIQCILVPTGCANQLNMLRVTSCSNIHFFYVLIKNKMLWLLINVVATVN
jgi:hypothetical protein